MDTRLAQERSAYQKRIETALDEDEDPLAVYYDFVQWIMKNEPDTKTSGLLPLLEQATRKFKNDAAYKTDLRYLKLWILYAKNIEKGTPAAVYGFLLKNDIGTTYSVLYEEFAGVLEREGRISDADVIYRKGIKRQARPVEKLKTRYHDFKRQCPAPTTSAKPQSSEQIAPGQSASSPYAHMLVPPGPGRRQEKLRFSLPLLFTEDGIEYSIQEARARSMGLLGKKWGPPDQLSRSTSSTASMSLSHDSSDSDDGGKPTARKYATRRSLGLGLSVPEPTVTINTKEALADVFGMYNSPDKTVTTTFLRPGGKYAPVKRFDMSASLNAEPKPDPALSTSTAGFRPFVDENAIRKENATPGPKLKPYVDPEMAKTPFTNQAAKLPLTTPRFALAPKEYATPSPLDRNENNENALGTGIKVTRLAPVRESEETFARVFTPAASSRTQSAQQETTPAPAFKPFVDDDARTPFKVFSRPEQGENGYRRENVFSTAKPFTPFSDKPTFTPFKDRDGARSSFTPFRDKPSEREPERLDPFAEVMGEEEEQEQEEMFSESTDDDEYGEVVEEDQPLPSPSTGTSSSGMEDWQESQGQAEHAEGEGEYFEDNDYAPDDFNGLEAPLGGRFGAFNVMTPITERTFEYTTTRSVFATPSDRNHSSGPHAEDYDAVGEAERLAEEVRAEDITDRMRLGTVLEAENQRHRQLDEEVNALEERTGKLNLLDTLTKTSKFKPPNPCNAFDPPIVSTLLTLVTSDAHFYDLSNYESNTLDVLQRFAKKSRKTSGSSSHGGHLDIGDSYPVALGETQFDVSEKLGEGGFGAVFRAKERKGDGDDEDDEIDLCEDEDEGSSSVVAIKIVKPRNLWEYHVLRRLHTSLPQSLRRSVILPQALYAFRDESFLVLELCPQGSLLAIVNNAVAAGVSQQGGCLDELLVMFFAVELVRLIEGLHRAGFIHGDLKIDNCLLRLEDVPGGAPAWESLYQPNGSGGWKYKGIKLIDFGRTIDTKLFPSGQQFIAEWPAEERDCREIREDQPWTYQTDYYGLAGIIYCMLFGKYMQSTFIGLTDSPNLPYPGPRYRVLTPFKRYWQSELWNKLFDILLNPSLLRSGGHLPVCDEVAEARQDMEAWLQKNCNRTSNTLKGLLKKVELSVLRASTRN
ncbi:hypothetical protein BDN71DRAFT_1389126 [Pleurotus eryngii]|uniref:Uncharacterized protein n=1 Tax=Pleurotus eryngii TaxID=5323 RepID=A0A9P6DHL7_PLEER|nr:hypothetical protein BDN71DRAFT_1389126 [Pleurotus eryngii]